MAKKIKGEDGKTYKEQKPFYKKVWFIVLVAIIIIIALGSQGSSKKSTKDSNGGTKVESKTSTKKNKQNDDKKEEKKYYGVGDSVNVGDVIYTLNAIELTDERNQFAETEPEHVVKVSYTMENKTDSDSDLPVGMDLSAYGPDNKKLDSYPNDNTMGSVAQGKAIDVVQHFGINSLGEMELQFAPLISLKKTADFKVEVK